MAADSTHKLSDAEARTLVGSLKGITRREIKKLHKAKILTLKDLWKKMGSGKEPAKVSGLAADTKISADRLIELLPPNLVDVLCRELLFRATDLDLNVPATTLLKSKPRESPTVPRKVRLVAKKAPPWFRRHLLDLILLFGVFGLAILLVSALGGFDRYSSRFELNENVVIATRDLKTGDVLDGKKDLSTAHSQLREDYFKSTADVEGLVVSRDVSKQKPLRFKDLLRFQLVATRDILPGEKITSDTVKLAWSNYDPRALIKSEEVFQYKSRYAIRKDSVIRPDMLTP